MHDKDVPTISNVAKAAGVSRATVSRAFTRSDLVSAETVERILKVAGEIGYVPNYAARALSTGKHGNVALIVPDIVNPFFPPMIREAQREADRFDFCVFLGNTDENWRQEDKLLNRLAGQVEGVVLVASRLTDERIRAHANSRPLVLINRDLANLPRVLIDSALGVKQAVVHLAELGHRNVTYVSGPSSSWSNQQRRAAVYSSAKAFGMEVTTIKARVPTHELGRRIVPEILATGATAAIAFDDVTAQGILIGLTENGVSVPQQFSLVGCDDIMDGAATSPPLTTVSSKAEEAGRTAVSLLLDLIRGPAGKDVRYALETHLIVRGTTAPRPKKR